MSSVMTASEVLDREFLEIRAKILEIAASLDRLDRGAGSVDEDARRDLLQRSISILLENQGGRAERVQMLFSLPFEADWRRTFGI